MIFCVHVELDRVLTNTIFTSTLLEKQGRSADLPFTNQKRAEHVRASPNQEPSWLNRGRVSTPLPDTRPNPLPINRLPSRPPNSFFRSFSFTAWLQRRENVIGKCSEHYRDMSFINGSRFHSYLKPISFFLPTPDLHILSAELNALPGGTHGGQRQGREQNPHARLSEGGEGRRA